MQGHELVIEVHTQKMIVADHLYGACLALEEAKHLKCHETNVICVEKQSNPVKVLNVLGFCWVDHIFDEILKSTQHLWEWCPIIQSHHITTNMVKGKRDFDCLW